MRDPKMLAAVEQAEAAIHAAYVAACERAGAAVDPADMGLSGWVCDLLAEAYEAQLLGRE